MSTESLRVHGADQAALPRTWVATILLSAMLLGVATGLIGAPVVAAMAVMIAIAVVAFRPEVGAIVLLAATPLVVGIDRGVVVPLLRPNEALLLVVAAGVALRGFGELLSGGVIRVRVTPVHAAIIAMAVTSSVTPLLWMAGRGRPVELDDVLYASAMWKYLLLFIVVRAAVRTDRQVAVALGAMLVSGAVVAAVAVTQSMGLFGVPSLLARWYAPSDLEGLFDGRGTSTLSSSIAVGDVMAVLLAAVMAVAIRHGRHRPLVVAFGAVFVLGAIGSGQFSGAAALVVAALVAAGASGRLRSAVLYGVPAALVTGLMLWPVVGVRLSGFAGNGGMPQSWSVRLENLRTFFWPVLRQDFNWTLGVRPSARVAAPEPWREWVFIESGYTWLLWNGGLPLLVSFFVFVAVAIKAALPLATAPGAVGVAATAALAWICVVVVLMAFDPHLTMRGTGDIGFSLLALALTGVGRSSDVVAPSERIPWASSIREDT